MMNQSMSKPRPMKVMAQIVAMTDVTPLVRRLTFGGEALKAIVATGAFSEPAAWVKIFPPQCHGRAYTIRQLDTVAGTVDIDFVLHSQHQPDAVTVSAWVEQAYVGTEVALSYPARGGFTVNRYAQWLWMAADATALPALQSILTDLPLGLDVYVLVYARHLTERQPLMTKAELHETWLYPNSRGYVGALKTVTAHAYALAKASQGQVWLAGESNWVKNWQLYWLREQGQTPNRLCAQGYWKQGEADFKDKQLLAS